MPCVYCNKGVVWLPGLLQLFCADDVGIDIGTGTMKFSAPTGIMGALGANCIDGVMNVLATTGFIDVADPIGLSSG